MDFKKMLSVGALVFILSGCVTTNTTTAKAANPYEQGYRDGVKQNINGVVEKLNGNDFPYAGSWSEPIIQEVVVPAHIKDGVFYPESKQTVLITPGEWKKHEAFPIKSQRKENDHNEDTLHDISFSASDITVLPKDYSSGASKNAGH